MKEIHQSDEETLKKKSHGLLDSASSSERLPWSCWASSGSFWRQRWPSTSLPGSPRISFPEKHSPRPRAPQTPLNSCGSEGQSHQSPWCQILKWLSFSLRQIKFHDTASKIVIIPGLEKYLSVPMGIHLLCSIDICLNKPFDRSPNSAFFFYWLIRLQAVTVNKIYMG